MWTRTLAVLLSLLFLIPSASGQVEHFVLLPAHEVRAVSKRYSKERSEKYEGTWEPTKADLDGLEKCLPQISKMKIFGWPSTIHIEHPERYFRQNVAVVVAGKEMIFVNAFSDVQEFPRWRNRLVVVADGDLGFWQALYDPGSMQFSNLRINARA